MIMKKTEWAPEKMTKVCLENGYSGKIYYNPMRITMTDAEEFIKKKR